MAIEEPLSKTRPAAVRAPARSIGRYALFGEIASGGMATVHFGRLVGPAGFSRLVAIKRLLPQFAKDADFVAMFLDEARLASRIQHPNVVSTLDVVTLEDEIFLVMDYVQGETLSRLLRNASRNQERMPPGHVAAVLSGALRGLHAAHEAKSERREPLNIVHRDVSPQNVIVGVDGVARVLDFGVAKAAMRSQSTREGVAKGKLSYMSPEQLDGKAVDRRTDVFAAGVVLWEALCGQRLFAGADAGEVFGKILSRPIPEPKSVVPDLPEELNWVTMRALERSADQRFQTAREFAIELEGAAELASAHDLGEWVQRLGGEALRAREEIIAEVESASTDVGELRAAAAREGAAVDQQAITVAPPGRAGAFEAVLGGAAIEQSSPSGEIARPSERSAIRIAPGAQASVAAVSGGAAEATPPARKKASWPLLIAACVAGSGVAFLVYGKAAQPTTGVNGGVTTASAPAAAPEKTPDEAPAAVNELPKAPLDEENFGSAEVDQQGASERTPSAPVASNAQAPAFAPGSAGVEPAPSASKTHSPAPAAKKTKAAAPQPAVKKPAPAAAAPAARKPESKSAVNCNPPWLIDDKGIRRLKSECL